MKTNILGRLLVKITLSFLFGGLFNMVWLAAFIQVSHLDNALWKAIGWFLAPVMTAAGFATGIVIFEILSKTKRTGYFRIFPWPLIGCAAGAGAIYWLGPMLIGFGMFVAGTASVALRELFLNLKKTKG
jgi:hypothetical protein